MWVRGSFDAFAWFGGSGGTIVLIIAILLFSKRADYLTVGKLSLGPGIFNINEPIMFGLPVVLNAIIFLSDRCRLARTNRSVCMYGSHFLDLDTVCYRC